MRDEVGGPSDLLVHDDGRLFLSVDGGFDRRALYEISPDRRIGRNLADRSNMNGLAFDPDQEHIYAVESFFNQLVQISLTGELRVIAGFPLLERGQEAVPAGVAVNPITSEVFVALFSGALFQEDPDEVILFVPGDSKVVRVNPLAGTVSDEITGLTTAVDLAFDEAGNLYVVEMTSAFIEPFLEKVDFFDPHLPPMHGGYQRFSGKVTQYPSDHGPPRVLARGLDTPTNITYGSDGALYVSTGQGTPGRPIPGPDGPTKIVGQVLRITW